MMPDPDETSTMLANLLAQCARGDESALERLLARTARPLRTIAVRVLRSQSLADDALQESFIKVWQHAGRFDPERGAPMTWLATIVRRQSLDLLRRADGPVDGDLADDVQGDDSVLDLVAALDRQQIVEEVLRSACAFGPLAERGVEQVYLYGFSAGEAARRLGVPEATVRTWVRRSLARTKQRLDTHRREWSPAAQLAQPGERFEVRLATPRDIDALEGIVPASSLGLIAPYYSTNHVEQALRRDVFGLERGLIFDQTLFVVTFAHEIVGFGGWSQRRLPYFGSTGERFDSAPILDPKQDAALLRSFYVHPKWARRGVGSLLFDCCQDAARRAGFANITLLATRGGQELFAARGCRVARATSVGLDASLNLPGVVMDKRLPKRAMPR